MTAATATTAIFRNRTMQASFVGPGEPEPDHARAAARMILDLLDRGAIEALAHFLAGLEERRELLRDRHLVACARIAAGASLALLGRERAEAAQFDPLATSERVCDLAKDGVDDVLDVALIEMRIAGRHALHELRLDHRTSPTRPRSFAAPSCPEIMVHINSNPSAHWRQRDAGPASAEPGRRQTVTPNAEPHTALSGETAPDRTG